MMNNILGHLRLRPFWWIREYVEGLEEEEREIIIVCSLLNIPFEEGERLINNMRDATMRCSRESPISFRAMWGRNWDIAKRMMSEGRWHFEIWTTRCKLGNYL